MKNSITNSLIINVKTVEEAPNYSSLNEAGDNWKILKISRAIIVKEGMKSGSASVDLQCEDGQGNQYVIMCTGGILQMLNSALAPHMTK